MTTGSGQQTTYGYEPKRNLRTSIQNRWNGSLISQYDYEYDELGRRTAVANSGTSFSQSAFNHYAYNDRSELIESARYLGTDLGDLSNPVDDEYRSYDYDPIGNREQSVEGIVTHSYTTNALNQYIAEDIDGQPKSFGYDLDGNMTAMSDAASSTEYTYNAENRLIEVGPDTPAVGDTKSEVVYDYMGRRVRKTVSEYSAGGWDIVSDKLFIYDGWNLIEEEETVSSESKYYVWGLDLSQSLQGAYVSCLRIPRRRSQM